jgi:3-dehydroquinate synthase
MPIIPVKLGKESYNVWIERGLLDHAGEKIRPLTKAEKIAVVSDDRVAPLYGKRLETSLRRAGFETRLIIMEHGEENKNGKTLFSLWEDLADFGLTRSDAAVTLSGGVPGDLGGFAAATYMRGIDLFQIPTSLLAQIDSSVGGKTAIDLPEGKNLAGAFYQPKAVLIDPSVLSTLPDHFVHDGLGEAIKCGAIGDPYLFHMFETMDPKDLFSYIDEIIFRCVQLKASVVAKDEFDQGTRQILNFGHTLGHALEAYTHYSRFSHGEAVAAGMVEMTRKTEALGVTKKGTAKRLEETVKKFSLPADIMIPGKDCIPVILHDKKRRGSSITLVWLKEIGKPLLHAVEAADLSQYIETAGDRSHKGDLL